MNEAPARILIVGAFFMTSKSKFLEYLLATTPSRVNIGFQSSPVFLTQTKRPISILIGRFSAVLTTTKNRNLVIEGIRY